MLEKCFHFISQSLLMAHLLGRGPSTFWQKDSRHYTSSHTTEEHLTQIPGHLACGPQLHCCAQPSSSSHMHKPTLAWLAAAAPGQHLVSDR